MVDSPKADLTERLRQEHLNECHPKPHYHNGCPGSVYTPTKDGRCLCGYPRESHDREHDGRGGFRLIEHLSAPEEEEEEQEERVRPIRLGTDVRYRLIPSRGEPSWHVEGYEEAKREGEEGYALTGVPILLCRAPEGGTVHCVETIGGKPVRVRR